MLIEGYGLQLSHYIYVATLTSSRLYHRGLAAAPTTRAVIVVSMSFPDGHEVLRCGCPSYTKYLVISQLCMSCAKHTVWQKQKLTVLWEKHNLVISGSIVQCSFDEQTSGLTSSMKHCATEELPSLQAFVSGSLELSHLSFCTP